MYYEDWLQNDTGLTRFIVSVIPNLTENIYRANCFGQYVTLDFGNRPQMLALAIRDGVLHSKHRDIDTFLHGLRTWKHMLDIRLFHRILDLLIAKDVKSTAAILVKLGLHECPCGGSSTCELCIALDQTVLRSDLRRRQTTHPHFCLDELDEDVFELLQYTN